MKKKAKKKKKNKGGRPKQKAVPLKDKLDAIYNSVDLSTTCNHRLECCKTACPQMYYSEFTSLINEVWGTASRSDKIDMICKSIEYFFEHEYEKWGNNIFHKPCMLLNEEEGLCKYYSFRPLNCRLYGLWPEDEYNSRVDKFEEAYKDLGLKREGLPLCTQCPNVKRANTDEELTTEIIETLFRKIEDVDRIAGKFSEAQIKSKDNYRTFHDWLLLKIFGEDWLVSLTSFMLAADKDLINSQVKALEDAVRAKFSKDMPSLGIDNEKDG